MNALLQLPVVRTLHARGLLFVVILVPVVAGVLLSGALEEEPTPTRGEVPTTVERATASLLSLRPDLEKTPLSYQADYWAQLAEGAVNQIVLIGPNRVPGLVMADGYVLTSIAAVAPVAEKPPPQEETEAPASSEASQPGDAPTDEPVAVAAPATDQPSEGEEAQEADEPEREERPENVVVEPAGPGLLAVDWDSGLALFQLGDPATASAFELGDTTALRPGSFAAAVTRTIGGQIQIMPGHVSAAGFRSGTDESAGTPEIAIPLPASSDVAAIVDLDGGLVGAAFRRAAGVHVLSTDELLDTVTLLRDRPVCYPILTTNLTEEIQSLLDVSAGVAVERVRSQAFPSESPIRPGDVLLEWDAEPISSVDQFQELYRRRGTGDIVEFSALRGTRRVTGSVALPDRHCRPLLEDPSTDVPRLGLAIQWSTDEAGWQLARVTPEGPADLAGLQPGDRILTVNGRELGQPNALRTLQRLIQQEPAIVFTIERNEGAALMAVTPSEP